MSGARHNDDNNNKNNDDDADDCPAQSCANQVHTLSAYHVQHAACHLVGWDNSAIKSDIV